MVTGQGREPLLHASGFLLGKDRLRLRTPAYTSRRFSLPQGTKYSSVIAIYAVSIAKQGRNVKENTMIVQYYGGDDREAAFKVKAPPYNPPENQSFGLRECYGRQYEKRLTPNVRASSSLGISPFFLSVSRTRWLRHRPAVWVCGIVRGGRSYVLCGGLHLIRQPMAATFPSRGRQGT